jgi:hypothetical protein
MHPGVSPKSMGLPSMCLSEPSLPLLKKQSGLLHCPETRSSSSGIEKLFTFLKKGLQRTMTGTETALPESALTRQHGDVLSAFD